MLFGPNIKYFNELEINGEHVDDSDNEDFTNDRQDPDEDGAEETGTGDEGTDDLDDFTEDEFDVDDEPVDDINDEEPIDDTTEDNQEDENQGDLAEDDTEVEPVEGEETGAGDEGTDDLDDFTEDEFDADDEGTEGEIAGDEGEPVEGEETDTGDDESANTEESTDNQSGGTLADMEKNLFSDLTPQQLAIKNNELLQNYIELYETIGTIFDSINKIPKTFDNTRPLSFIADQLVSLKDMVNYVITTTYVTRTYVENMAYYKQALVVLEQLNTMLKALVQKQSK